VVLRDSVVSIRFLPRSHVLLWHPLTPAPSFSSTNFLFLSHTLSVAVYCALSLSLALSRTRLVSSAFSRSFCVSPALFSCYVCSLARADARPIALSCYLSLPLAVGAPGECSLHITSNEIKIWLIERKFRVDCYHYRLTFTTIGCLLYVK